MLDPNKNIDNKSNERFKVMAVRLANYLDISRAETWEALPPRLKDWLGSLSYSDIVRPLIIDDYEGGGKSVRQLANRYGVSSRTVFYHLGRKNCFIN